MTEDVLLLVCVAGLIWGGALLISCVIVPRVVRRRAFRWGAGFLSLSLAGFLCALCCVGILWQAGNSAATGFGGAALVLLLPSAGAFLYGLFRKTEVRRGREDDRI